MKKDFTFTSKLYDVSLIGSHQLRTIKMNETKNSSQLESKFDQSSDVASDQAEQISTNEMKTDLVNLSSMTYN